VNIDVNLHTIFLNFITFALARNMEKKLRIKVKTDEPELEVPIEEHFVLRLFPKLADKLSSSIKKRDLPADLEFSFHGILEFNIGF
jgi:hypothetical protein